MQPKEIQFSHLVYLFSDHFAAAAPLVGNKEPCLTSTIKVNQKGLSEAVCSSALGFLKTKGYITMEIVNSKKFFIFNKQEVFVKKTENIPTNLTGLEERIYNQIRNDTKVLFLILGLTDDCFNPWETVINIVKDDLVARGVLKKETVKKLIFTSYHYSLIEDRIDDYKAKLHEADEAMTSMRQNGDMCKVLKQEIGKAIALRQEKPDSDSD
jgi:hypothetical protein